MELRKAAAALTLAGGLLAAVGCSGGHEHAPLEAPVSKSVPSDPLTQMSIAFDGQPSPMTIRPVLDAAMEATNTPISDDTYSRAGSVLVSLRQQNGTAEMSILRCMPSRVHDPRLPEFTFSAVAAVCSVDIVQGAYSDDESSAGGNS